MIASDLNLIRTGPRRGSPVVLVHPVGLDLTYWDAQIAALRDDYDVIAVDLPGHGRSPGTPEDWTLDNVAALLADVVQNASDRPAHIVGLSVGGMIAQKLTITFPSLVRTLSLIDTAATFPAEARAGMRDRAATVRREGMAGVLSTTLDRWFTAATRAERPDIIDRVSKTLLNDDPQIHGAMWDMISALDLVDQLACIACPTLVLVGEFDPSSPPAAARLLAENIEHARMHVIVGASHMAPLERPAVVSQHLRQFLAEQAAGTS